MQSQNTFEFGHRTMRHIGRAAFAVALIVSVLPVQASPVTGTLSFIASGFPAGAPNDPVTGAVHFSFDNAAEFFNKSDGALVNNVTIDIDLLALSLPGAWGPLVMTYLNRVGDVDVLVIGQGPITLIAPGTQDFLIAISNVSTNPQFRRFAYASADIVGSNFVTLNGSVAVVPEPATLAIAAAGLAVIGGLRRRRPAVAGL